MRFCRRRIAFPGPWNAMALLSRLGDTEGAISAMRAHRSEFIGAAFIEISFLYYLCIRKIR